mmetsp:Transcript_121958/g.272647  ORF Transcript_121958/g.272647 Transcript_121958/m.272647 type:complete len:234 (-) Transcript_121958:753-1454(-)
MWRGSWPLSAWILHFRSCSSFLGPRRSSVMEPCFSRSWTARAPSRRRSSPAGVHSRSPWWLSAGSPPYVLRTLAMTCVLTAGAGVSRSRRASGTICQKHFCSPTPRTFVMFVHPASASSRGCVSGTEAARRQCAAWEASRLCSVASGRRPCAVDPRPQSMVAGCSWSFATTTLRTRTSCSLMVVLRCCSASWTRSSQPLRRAGEASSRSSTSRALSSRPRPRYAPTSPGAWPR